MFLGALESLESYILGGMFQLVNVATTCLTIKFRLLTYYIGW